MQTEFDTFISGREVDLVVVDENLAENTNWYQWFNDEETTHLMQKHYYPNTRQQQKEYVRTHILDNDRKLQCGIVHKKDLRLIGMVSLSRIDLLHRTCEIGGIIGEKEYKKLIYFVEATQLLLAHAFDQLNMHKITGGTIIRDVAELFIRVLGFSLEGTRRRQIYKNGSHHDEYLIGLLWEEYYAKKAPETT